ncbi:hypothetical protein [Reyranella soli]|uniref:STAS domain-containing protein n=1 Tax=Reyranella soli TaxID=1230389 RepID=A0A512NEZ2_9HYPH|nr:hypothetical protein [Reyranella soli]GEP57517.1 hypothetical protein RSO01_46830 [Reyranella soli]
MFTIEFDRQHRVALLRFWNTFNSDDIQAIDEASAALVAAEGPAHFLFDFTSVSGIAMPDRAIRERGRRRQLCPGYQRVVVARHPEIVGLYRLFGAVQSRIGSVPPVVVPTVADALDRLDVRNPDFRLFRREGHKGAKSSF